MAATDIKVTEIMYDPIQTGVVADRLHEWVEIQNTGTTAVTMNGWTLDDSRTTTNTSVGTIANTTLQPGQIAILYNADITEAQFLASNPTTVPGTVLIPVTNWQQLNNSNGAGGAADTVNLVDNLGNPIAAVTYTDVATAGNSINYPPAGAQSVGAPDPGVVCFTAGSLIETEHGLRRIEELQVGDLIRTLDNGLLPLRWIGRRVVSAEEQVSHPEFCPIRIEKGALGPHTPIRNTQVSPQHRVLLDGATTRALFGLPRMLCSAVSLTKQQGIEQMSPDQAVEYIHILFDQHEVVFVDGLPSESFFPCESGIAALSPLARDELFALFPEVESAAFPVAYPVMSSAEAALLSL